MHVYAIKKICQNHSSAIRLLVQIGEVSKIQLQLYGHGSHGTDQSNFTEASRDTTTRNIEKLEC